MRQVDAGPGARRPRAGHLRPYRAHGPADGQPGRSRAGPAHPARLPGPLLLPQPPPHRLDRPERGPHRPSPGHRRRRAPPSGRRPAGHGRSRAPLPGALPPRALRGPGATGGHRPGPGRRTTFARARRADVGPRRLRTGRGDEPPGPPPGPAGTVLRLHQPRPGHGAPHKRHHFGDVPGQDRRVGPYQAVLGAPLHPYTRALAEAVPLPDPETEAGRRKASTGEVGALGAEAPTGCPYHPRCPLAEEICRAQVPELLELGPGHEVACHVAAREASAPGAPGKQAAGPLAPDERTML